MIGYAPTVNSPRVVNCTPQLLELGLTKPGVRDICTEIEHLRAARERGDITPRQFDDRKNALKRQLPIITPHATFTPDRRSNANARPTGLCMYDKDHTTRPREYWQEALARLRRGGYDRHVAFVHITPSGEGLRIVFVTPHGLTLRQAQEWMARTIGDDDYDESVCDLARCSFLVPRDYVLHLNTDLLFAAPEDLPDYTVQLPPATPAVSLPPATPLAPAATPPAAGTAAPPALDYRPVEGEPAFKGVPYRLIVEMWLHDRGGMPQPGERNATLYRLATHLRNICDHDPELILRLLPPCGLSDSELRVIVNNALKGDSYNVPRAMRSIVSRAAALMHSLRPDASDTDGSDAASDTSAACPPADPSDYLASPLPPPMPARLPTLVSLLLSKTPAEYQPAVAHAVFPPLAAHLCGVTFRYIDNVDHEATLMNILMAGTGAGKNCVTEPINRIMADIRQRDADSLRIEREWKEEVSTRGANQDRRRRPKGLVIQEIDPDITHPAFIMRTADSGGHFLYAHMNEIEQFDSLRGSARQNAQFQIMCLAFDPGNHYGQTRVSAGAISEKVTVRFNWNASTTITQGQRYFHDVLTNGPLTRINFCTIPEREIGAPMPVFGTYDSAFDAALRPYIRRLTTAHGLVDCPPATHLAHVLAEECAAYARLNQSRTFENFSFRALVIAYLKACVLYVADARRWDPATDEFIRWSLRYDLWCKMRFFGNAVETEQRKSDETFDAQHRRGPRNLLSLLPDEFTRSDVAVLRSDRGLDAKGTGKMLRNWLTRKYIIALDDGLYRKLNPTGAPVGASTPPVENGATDTPDAPAEDTPTSVVE